MFNVVFAFLMFIPAFMGRDGGSMIQAMQSSAHTVWMVVAGTFSMIGHLFAGQNGMANISGPVGIAVMAGQAASDGLVNLLFFTGVLSLSLGIMNLMPFPGLDGGQLLILLIETVLDRPLATRAHQAINVAGIMLITGLSIVVTWHDIVRLAS
jgi:regulator of sigma E protease